jgi:hypothetical protein
MAILSAVPVGSEISACCCDHCVVEEDPSEYPNTFEITEEEFNDYYNGGIWAITGDGDYGESLPDGRYLTASGSGSDNIETSGCEQLAGSYFPVSGEQVLEVGEDPVPIAYDEPYGITLTLYKFEDQFFAQFTAYIQQADTDPASTTGYPPTISLSVDGHTLTGYGHWSPDWAVETGYSNTTSVTLTATFTPT